MLINDLRKIALKNIMEFDKSRARLASEDEIFVNRVIDTKKIIEKNIETIVDSLEDYFDYENISIILLTMFERERIYNILRNTDFVAFLIQSNLATRTINLTKASNAKVKIRIYFAMLDFEYYTKKRGIDL